MKYIKYIIATAILFTFSCRDEDKLTLNIDDVPHGIFVTFVMESATINSSDLGNTNISGVFDAPSGNVAKHNIYVKRSYNSGADETDYLLLESISGFPVQWNVTAQELATLFGVDVDQIFGNFFEFDCQAIGTNGDTATYDNLSNNIKLSPEQLQGFQFSGAVVCPSDPALIIGSYSSLSSGESIDPDATNNPSVDFAYTITIAETEVNGEYTISDFSGGLYLNWYAIYGIAGDVPGTIQDVCGSYSYINTFDPFGATVNATVTLNDDGTILIDAINTWGDTWTSTLTKTN